MGQAPVHRHAQFMTQEQYEQLMNNGQRVLMEGHDPMPVVKLFTPDAQATWLLTEIDSHEPDLAFGLCDLGLGNPELGYVSLNELSAVRGKLGLPVERDLYFRPDKTLSQYADDAYQRGRIRA